MGFAVFIEPEEELRTNILRWKAKVEENFPKQRKTDTLLSVPFFKSPRFVHFFVAIFAFFAALPRIF